MNIINENNKLKRGYFWCLHPDCVYTSIQFFCYQEDLDIHYKTHEYKEESIKIINNTNINKNIKII